METLDVAKGDFSCLFKKTHSVFVTLILEHLLTFFFLHSVIVCFYLYMEHPWLLVKRQFSEKVKMMVHIYIKVNTISFNALFMRKPGRCYIRLERSQIHTNVYGIKGY